MTTKMKKYFAISGLIVTLIIISFLLWILQLNAKINDSLKTSWFVPPLEIYAQPSQLNLSDSVNFKQISQLLTELSYRKREADQPVFEKDFKLQSGESCHKEDFDQTRHCLTFMTPEKQTIYIGADEEFKITHLKQQNKSLETITLPAQLFAQFYGSEPTLRDIKELEEFPYQCLQAVTTIEDHQFLEHEGISLTGMLRAVYDLVTTGHFKSGGSTITQQLIKNYFLTSERTLKRKFTEIFMALILENKYSKEQILENYLNIIYMGQNGPFQIRGFAAAAQHYFKKDINQLNLPQCALLAGLLNSPGRYNPFTNPEKSIRRRNKVLNDMFKYQVIDQAELDNALNEPLPKADIAQRIPTAPYFVDAIRKQLKTLNIDDSQGLKVYSTLNPEAQEKSKSAIQTGLKHLYNRFKKLKKLEEEGTPLQAMIISVNLKNNEIQSLVGGSSYAETQYNRAIDSHRQVGSVMKPLVYLTALESVDENGQNYHPLKTIVDQPFKYKYEGQVWSPKNYSGKAWGPLPLFFALKNSINISTAKVGLQVGLENIIDVARRVGITSTLKPFPSLTLGAFELYPIEVLQAYSSIARMGKYKPVHFIKKVTDLKGSTIYTYQEEDKQVIAPEVAATLIGMLKQTIENGTGQSARAWGFKGIAAGKTGTTSDSKDAWFSGFTSENLTLAWVGYDDNTPHGLTGASAALPIWSLFMRHFNPEPQDFNWPESVKKVEVKKSDLAEKYKNIDPDKLDDAELIYRHEDLSLLPF